MRSTRSNNLVSHLLKGSFTNSATPFFFEQKMHYLPKKKLPSYKSTLAV
ncbi:hypothetical protein HNQ00_000866 [Flavobacterium sp. 14A]|nr:hypothetical protein [Flavobacterium sp. 14A]